MRCPHTQLRLRLGAAEISDTAAGLIKGLETAANVIESGTAQDALLAWTRATDAVAVGSAEVCLPALVATDAAARDAGAAAKRRIIDAFGNCYGRKALYDAIKASETTDPLLKRARDKHVARFEANGLALADVYDGVAACIQVSLEALGIPDRHLWTVGCRMLWILERIGVVWPHEKERARRELRALPEDGPGVALCDGGKGGLVKELVGERRIGQHEIVRLDVHASVLQDRRPIARARAHLHQWAVLGDRNQCVLRRYSEADHVADRIDNHLMDPFVPPAHLHACH